MRPVRALAASAVALAAALTALTATPAQAAPAPGTLSVTMVDENGAAMPGNLSVYSVDGSAGDQTEAVSTLEVSVPPGSYGVLALTPWGGMQCVGIAPCDITLVLGSGTDPDGSVVVESGETTTVTIHGETPAVLTGTPRVGSPLTVTYSTGMANLIAYVSAVAAGAYNPTVTWLRDGEPISGATGNTYEPVAADAGKEVSARLAYLGVAQSVFADLSGTPVDPRTTNAVVVKRIPTKAFAILSNPKVKASSRGKVRVEVTAPGQIVTGKVTVKVGSWSQTRSLINGSVRVLLPTLPAGKHPVKASFLGSPAYAPSTATSRTLTVTPG